MVQKGAKKEKKDKGKEEKGDEEKGKEEKEKEEKGKEEKGDEEKIRCWCRERRQSNAANIFCERSLDYTSSSLTDITKSTGS